MTRWTLVILILTSSVLFGQGKTGRGKITYISTDAVYISLGKNDNIADSSTIIVLEKSDTIAILKVFGSSSKSSICSIVKSKRQPKINDEVVSTITESNQTSTIQTQQQDTTASRFSQTYEEERKASLPKPFVTVNGRISYQYFSSVQSSAGLSFSQPGVVVNLRGDFNKTPIKFNMYGNFRSLAYGTQSLAPKGGANQTRIYRLSVEYDDTLNKISLGRIIPSNAPSIGYVDGGSYARTLGNFMVGLTGGFEPSFVQQGLSTDMKKFSVFLNYQDDSKIRPAVSVAYSRRYVKKLLDREVINSSLMATFFNDVMLYAQTDVDLRIKKGNNFQFSPKVSSLYANLNYRFSYLVSAGVGYNVWRPTYSYASVKTTPDSLLDNKTRSGLSVNISVFLPASISINNSFLPRSSDKGFGKEYSDNASVSAANIAGTGVVARISGNINSTTISSTKGYGAQLQRNVANIADISLRYQAYRFNITQTKEITTTNSFALDLMANIISNLSFWGSIERQTGFNTNGYTIISELSWRL